MKKNNKGFTLVELLAVIVVLAIIMVIATQQINKTINRSRAKSFNEVMNVVVQNVRILKAEGYLTQSELEESLDYNTADYNLIYTEPAANKSCTKIGIKAVTDSADGKVKGGKFKNVDLSLIPEKNSIYSYDVANEITTYMNGTGHFFATEAGCEAPK